MNDRTRTSSWHDPVSLVNAGKGMSGLEYLQAMQRGELAHPPIASTLDFRYLELDEGRAVMEMEPAEFHYNTIGTVHGGVIVAVLDSAAGSAVQSTLAAGVRYTTVSLNTSFLRPVRTETGPLRAEGRVLKTGRTMALSEAHLTDERGRLYAHATSNCLIFPSDE